MCDLETRPGDHHLELCERLDLVISVRIVNTRIIGTPTRMHCTMRQRHVDARTGAVAATTAPWKTKAVVKTHFKPAQT